MKPLVYSRVSVRCGAGADASRRRALEQWLRAKRFTLTADGGYQDEVEGETVKAELRAAGFTDRDFSLCVEFQRRWGFL